MFTKTTITALLAASLAGTTLAFNSHRHLHRERALHRNRDRALKVEWVTDWVTVTVTAGAGGAAETESAQDFYVNSAPESEENYAPQAPVEPVPITDAAPAAAATPEPAPAAPPPPEAPAQAPPAPQSIPEVVGNIVAPLVPEVNIPTPSYGGGGKRGLSYNDHGLVDAFLGGHALSQGSWLYNWDSAPNGVSVPGFEFVPMLWGAIPVHTNRWRKNVEDALAGGSKHILSFNEPDFAAQANLSPGDAARAHVEWVNSYGDRARIGSPATSNSNIPGQGLDWLDAFMGECDAAGCKIDFCTTHWYHEHTALEDLFTHLEKVHEKCRGRPVWLTEFAPFGSDDQIAEFLRQALPRLDALPYLEKYCYFMTKVGSLLSGPGSLSAYGQVYAAS